MLKAKSVRGKTGASPKRGLAQYFVNNWDLYAMLLLPIVYIVIFKYVPMAGVQMAFRDYSVFKGMWDSPWVGLEHFKTFFSSSEFGKLLTNTLTLRGCLTARLLLPLLLLQPPARILPLRSAGVVEMYNKDINYRKTFGVEGENWKYVTPGEDDVPADATDFNTGDPAEIAPFIDGVGWGDEQDYCWRGLGLRCDTGDYKDLRYAQVQSGDYDTNMEHRLSVDTQEQMEPYYPDMEICVPTLVYTEEQSATLANTESVVISYVEEMAAAFITGTSDPEADWDAYLNELSVKGVDQLLEIYQAGYDARS